MKEIFEDMILILSLLIMKFFHKIFKISAMHSIFSLFSVDEAC